jgi:hypothetical protein
MGAAQLRRADARAAVSRCGRWSPRTNLLRHSSRCSDRPTPRSHTAVTYAEQSGPRGYIPAWYVDAASPGRTGPLMARSPPHGDRRHRLYAAQGRFSVTISRRAGLGLPPGPARRDHLGAGPGPGGRCRLRRPLPFPWRPRHPSLWSCRCSPTGLGATSSGGSHWPETGCPERQSAAAGRQAAGPRLVWEQFIRHRARADRGWQALWSRMGC